jgi:SAM-dependent MidA family methyltransferase
MLTDLIKTRIRAAGGSISFADYMGLALYTEGLGYYSGELAKFGAEGDFVTAPEISPLFGRCLARFISPILAAVPNGDILEFGAGTGRLAAILLQELRRLGLAPRQYLILEVSADLRARQQRYLKDCVPEDYARIVWLNTLPSAPYDGLVLANEVLDAMPVHRFELTADSVQELGVGWDRTHFVWRPTEIRDPVLATLIDRCLAPIRQDLSPPYRSEINSLLAPWLASVEAVLRRAAILCIDYGYSRAEYYHPQRRMGTLVCHHKHRAHTDPLILPGLQDITASVDFTAVAEAAVEHSLEVSAYTTLAYFLLASGLSELVTDAAQSDGETFRAYSKAAKTFLLPGEMGERFKLMMLTKNLDLVGVAPQVTDLRHQL